MCLVRARARVCLCARACVCARACITSHTHPPSPLNPHPTGTLSAVTDALEALTIPEVHVQVVDKGVGQVLACFIKFITAHRFYFNITHPFYFTTTIRFSQTTQVSSGDIDAAAANGAFIVTFNVKTSAAVQLLASQAAIPILSHRIIYHLLDDVRSRVVQLLPPLPQTEVTGRMRVLQVFDVKSKSASKVGG